jgi:hypothetical protein
MYTTLVTPPLVNQFDGISIPTLQCTSSAIKKNTSTWNVMIEEQTNVTDADLAQCEQLLSSLKLKTFSIKSDDKVHLGFDLNDIKTFFPTSIQNDTYNIDDILYTLYGTLQNVLNKNTHYEKRIEFLEQNVLYLLSQLKELTSFFSIKP